MTAALSAMAPRSRSRRCRLLAPVTNEVLPIGSAECRVGAPGSDPRADANVTPLVAMKVEILFLEGCPSHARLLPRVRELAEQAGAEVALRPVHTSEAAESERFLGSPTVRVDGRDVDPGAGERIDFGLKCRIYRSQELGQSAVPPEEWIRAALKTAGG